MSSSSIGVYARVRPLMPFEAGERKCIDTTNETITLHLEATGQSLRYPFTFVITERDPNDFVFEKVCLPMVKQVIEGYNAICIAYGQTGCGKTYTMLGKPHHNPPVVGLVPMTLQTILNYKPIPTVSLSVCESYGTSPSKINIYDLWNPRNREAVTGRHTEIGEKRWDKMTGSTNFDMSTLTKVPIVDYLSGHDIIVSGTRRTHVAPTGQNPDSSRGHTVILIGVKPASANAFDTIPASTFIFTDLAGSEGDTALTPKFIATTPPDVVLKRKLEAGVINTGLIQLKRMFLDLRKKGKLIPADKTGLKRILYPYINAETAMAVLFMMSPAGYNSTATNSTLKFAQEAAAIKVTPVKKEKKVNWEAVANSLEVEISDMKKEHAKLIANQGGNANGMINATFQKSKKTLTILCGDADVEIEYPQLDEAVAQVEITQKGLGAVAAESMRVVKENYTGPDRDFQTLMDLNDMTGCKRSELMTTLYHLESDVQTAKDLRAQLENERILLVEHMTEYVASLTKQLSQSNKYREAKSKSSGRRGSQAKTKRSKKKK